MPAIHLLATVHQDCWGVATTTPQFLNGPQQGRDWQFFEEFRPVVQVHNQVVRQALPQGVVWQRPSFLVKRGLRLGSYSRLLWILWSTAWFCQNLRSVFWPAL